MGVPQFGGDIELELVRIFNGVLSQSYQIDSSTPSTLVVSLEHNATIRLALDK